jgi:hypothetical protein
MGELIFAKCEPWLKNSLVRRLIYKIGGSKGFNDWIRKAFNAEANRKKIKKPSDSAFYLENKWKQKSILCGRNFDCKNQWKE